MIFADKMRNGNTAIVTIVSTHFTIQEKCTIIRKTSVVQKIWVPYYIRRSKSSSLKSWTSVTFNGWILCILKIRWTLDLYTSEAMDYGFLNVSNCNFNNSIMQENYFMLLVYNRTRRNKNLFNRFLTHWWLKLPSG